MSSRFALIVNPTSGRGRGPELASQIVRGLESRGHEVHLAHTESLQDGYERATRAAGAGWIPVAVGGDGLVSRVVRGTAEHGGKMAVVPAGTGNDFARSMGIRGVDPQETLARLSRNESKVIDLGICGSATFACVASVGLDSRVVERASNQTWPRGRATYPWAMLAELRTWKAVRFSLVIDGVEVEFSGYNVVVANSAYYGGGMKIAPDALADDGLLDVVAVTDISRTSLLLNVPRVFKGTHTRHAGVRCWRAREVRLACDAPLSVVADGEVVAKPPTNVSIRTGAVSVLV